MKKPQALILTALLLLMLVQLPEAQVVPPESGAGGGKLDASYVVMGLDADLTVERVLTGTANQVTVTDGGANGNVTLSTPQDIHTGASPTFTNLTLSGGVVTPTPNILEQRNGANAQTYRLYNTFTDTLNFERFGLRWATNVATLDVEALGTGTPRDLRFRVAAGKSIVSGANQDEWFLTGNLRPVSDNTLDVGSSTQRPRDVFAGTSFNAGTSPATAGHYRLPSSGTIQGRNGANTADHVLVTISGADEGIFGPVGTATRIRTSLGVPTTLANGDWWVECSGTSPDRNCSIKVQDTGATRTIATSANF